ncbi:5'-deoxynucleotidase [Paenibacillus doosanensis]|uniref:5'-deoxynucleotidase YfbR n=1 Tax=Paenibacillus konkukensis TaxID=2020716 RepID=A0ABY4RKT5_9BACL|nr:MULTISPECIES: 5'-deoxynucleotidase [Paenibacillus]MCS7462568.1 5'-deoxynucleotidase [Paenibacillus doosanensis]UQZ83116.1 5'-deoxynucleotidase YfbR [Paenibacillus konkukensis]
MDSHFFAYMYRLRYIERWSLMRNILKENVAEHSFHVALLTHVLCTIANEEFGRNVPTDRIVSMALFHDATEVFTGDIPTPVKHHNPKILSNFRDIEQLAAERLLDMIPPKLKPVYEPLIDAKSSGLDPELKRYVKAADLLDAYLKCVTELSAGNKEFGSAKKQIEQSIQEMNMPEMEYFLKHMAPSLEKTLDELSEESL